MGIRIEESGAVVYEDGSIGSSVYTLVSYFSQKDNEETPWDAQRFLRYMKMIGVDVLLIIPSKRKLQPDSKQEFLEAWKKLY